MTQTLQYTVRGEERIHCEGCERRIINALQRLEGVAQARASADKQRISVSIDAERIRAEQVEERLGLLGYEVERG